MSKLDFTRTTKQPSQDTLQRYHHYLRQTRGSKILFWTVYALVIPVFFLFFRIRQKGKQFVPSKGGVVVAANHKSFFDPFFMAILQKRRIFFVAKAELFAHPILGWIFVRLGAIPIQRGLGDQDAIQTALTLLQSGEMVGIFPEGTRVEKGKESSAKKGAVRLAMDAGVPIVPVGIAGTDGVKQLRFKHKVALVAQPCISQDQDLSRWSQNLWKQIEEAAQQAELISNEKL